MKIFNRVNVYKWMTRNEEDYRDHMTGDINLTALTEAAADFFDVNHINGPLDDDTHWIWDIAVKVTSR
jgi:hypothetical protein